MTPPRYPTEEMLDTLVVTTVVVGLVWLFVWF
jgi:hypothetical protein